MSIESDQLELAGTALWQVMNRITKDARVAYLIGPGSETFEQVTAACAALSGMDEEFYREKIAANLNYQPVPRLGHDGDSFDLVAHLHRQREFSTTAFGPGERTRGVIAHIRKELVEVEESEGSLNEWVDVILLAFDGAWRSGKTPEQIAQAIAAKQAVNQMRSWPDWRTADKDAPIEHVRSAKEGGAS